MKEPMITLRDVHKWYGKLHVLRGVDLVVGQGEVVVLCGPSGSGKSTLLRCINHLETITSGSMSLRGFEPEANGKIDLNRLRAEIGMVFQQFNLFPHLTVLDNITLAPMRVGKMGRDKAEATAMGLLTRVGHRREGDRLPEPAARAASSSASRSPARLPWTLR